MFKRLLKTQNPNLEVKEFYVTDNCDYCGSPQGGYVNANLDRYLNVRDGHKCANCGVPEKPL
jgi:hypothetical protein